MLLLFGVYGVLLCNGIEFLKRKLHFSEFPLVLCGVVDMTLADAIFIAFRDHSYKIIL